MTPTQCPKSRKYRGSCFRERGKRGARSVASFPWVISMTMTVESPI